MPLKIPNQNHFDKVCKTYEKLSQKYGFNYINMQEVYVQQGVLDFWQNKNDKTHEISTVMQEIGKQIVLNLDKMSMPKLINFTLQNPEFLLLEMEEIHKVNKEIEIYKNFYSNEKVMILHKDEKIYFDKKYKDCYPICISTSHLNKQLRNKSPLVPFSTILFQTQNESFTKGVGLMHENNEIGYHFKIDENSYFSYGNTNPINERSIHTGGIDNPENNVGFLGFINILFAKGGKWEFEDITQEEFSNYDQYNFNHLVPNMLFLKNVIEQYNQRYDPIKLAPFKKQISDRDNLIKTKDQQINTLTNENTKLNNTLNSIPHKKATLELQSLEQDIIYKKLNIRKTQKELGLTYNQIEPKIIFNPLLPNTARARIKNQLAYKLGVAIIENSKSLWGYIRMPYVLSYIKDKHQKEQKLYHEAIKQNPSLKLPRLENYPDYKNALKEKESLTYKLGLALIEADKAWYKGGFVKFWFVARTLKKNFKAHKNSLT